MKTTFFRVRVFPEVNENDIFVLGVFTEVNKNDIFGVVVFTEVNENDIFVVDFVVSGMALPVGTEARRD